MVLYCKGKEVVYLSILRDIRISKRMTQSEAALALGISVRSYKSYENDVNKREKDKYKYLVSRLEAHVAIDRKHGVLTLEEIKRGCKRILSEYESEVSYAVLFGSYARGKARKDSDVNLLISTSVSGLRLSDMRARLEDVLHKRVSLLERKLLPSSPLALDQILMYGIRVY